MSDFVFVTGGSGFVGSNVIEQLVEDMDSKPWSKIVCLFRNEEAAKKAKNIGVDIIYGSLLQPSEKWTSVASNASYVIHCAQPAFTSQNYETERILMEKNLISALDPKKVKRAVFCYGSSYFGQSESLIDESVEERNPVGIGILLEKPLELVRNSKLNFVNAFVGGVYGVGSWFTELFLNAFNTNDPIFVKEPSPIWPFIHVRDVARALEFLLYVSDEKLKSVGRDIILADDMPITILQFLQHMAEFLHVEPNIQMLNQKQMYEKFPSTVAQYLCSNMNHSNKKLKQLGFQLDFPTVEAGLKNTLASP